MMPFSRQLEIIRRRRRDACISLPCRRSLFCRDSSCAAWCHDVLYFAYRMPIPRSTQQHFRNANVTSFLLRRPTTATFAPEIDFVLPANRYTFYALRLVCRFRPFHVPSGISCARLSRRWTSGCNISFVSQSVVKYAFSDDPLFAIEFEMEISNFFF